MNLNAFSAYRQTLVMAALCVVASTLAASMAMLGRATWLEAASFITGAVCVWLIVKENIWNFPIGLVNVATFSAVFYQNRLFADAGLQVIYFVLGIMGCCLAAMSGSCADAEPTRKQAIIATDASTDAANPKRTPELPLKDRDAVYCEPKLEVVCAVEEPGSNYWDFDAVVAKICVSQPGLSATKNSCGGLTLRFSRSFGGHLHWHYNEKHELVGASLSADTTQYCGKREVNVGTDCALTAATVPLCTKQEN